MKKYVETAFVFFFSMIPWWYLHFVVSMSDIADGTCFVLNFAIASGLGITVLLWERHD
jgi:hypothetical protein